MHLAPEACKAIKARGQRLSVLTAYDYPTARLIDESEVDWILVGDSLGMVILGMPDTTSVTMEHMLHHVEAVTRGAHRCPIIADLPAGSCATPKLAKQNAQRLIQAGAHAVKLEGGAEVAPHVSEIRAAGINVLGHIGMLPQRVREEGGYRVKGRTADDSARLLNDAECLTAAGISAIVLELVAAETAASITRSTPVPTIGIGSGSECDGQVLVFHDLVGALPWFRPRFVQPEADVATLIRKALNAFHQRTVRRDSEQT
jgi:3-methyl-2-oxobutanoate hydroxymethyltransferase